MEKQATPQPRGFQHGPGYYYMDSQCWTFDQYGCRVFRDDEEQTVEETSDEQGEQMGAPTEEEGDRGEDSEELPLVEVARRQAQEEQEEGESQEDEEIPDEE